MMLTGLVCADPLQHPENIPTHKEMRRRPRSERACGEGVHRFLEKIHMMRPFPKHPLFVCSLSFHQCWAFDFKVLVLYYCPYRTTKSSSHPLCKGESLLVG
jgi:hypothetical protein